MQKIALSFAILGLSAGAAFAQMDMSFADVDIDVSGEVSFAELQIAWPDVTQEEFDAADTDTSSGLSAAELDAMQASMTPDAATTAPAPAMAPAAPSTTTPATAPTVAPTPTDAPAATNLGAGSTSSSENDNMGGDAGAGN